MLGVFTVNHGLPIPDSVPNILCKDF
jgi:hypothetical protein